MKIVNARTVELTNDEAAAFVAFSRIIDEGYSTPVACARVEELHTGLDPAFYRWLRGEPTMPVAS